MYSDLSRPPLRGADLRRALVVPDGLWTRLDLHGETASTNADAVAAARDGVPEGLVVVAERQTAGRGRLGRRWESPPRAGLTVSVLLRPANADVPHSRYGWLPLLAGVALAEAVDRVAEVETTLKWPNDLLVDGRKCGGILAEAVNGAVVVGIGLNVSQREDELPTPDATSLALVQGSTDRDPLLRALLRAVEKHYRRWTGAQGDPDRSGLRERYEQRCATIGADVTVSLPDGTTLDGRATTVDADGRLVVGDRAVAAGDVVHVRPVR